MQIITQYRVRPLYITNLLLYLPTTLEDIFVVFKHYRDLFVCLFIYIPIMN